MFPLEFWGEVNHEETRVMGLLSGKSCMILTSSVCAIAYMLSRAKMHQEMWELWFVLWLSYSAIFDVGATVP